MRSAIHATFGEPADVLELGDRPVPQPGAGEVRIKTSLAPIHNHDLWTIRGRYGYKPELPAIGGSEAVGIVDALGEGVEGATVGQRVAVASAHGTWAEYFLAPARLLVPVPQALPDETAAQLIAEYESEVNTDRESAGSFSTFLLSLQARLFRDFEPNGGACHILATAFRIRNEKNWLIQIFFIILFQAQIRLLVSEKILFLVALAMSHQNTEMLLEIQKALFDAELLQRMGFFLRDEADASIV